MKEFDFKHNPDSTITALRLKNHKYVELLTFNIEDIPSLLADVCRRLPPEVRRYMEQVIDRIKSDYPLIAEKLKNYKGGTL